MVKKDHPLLALPCAFILSLGIGVALTVTMIPFSTPATLAMPSTFGATVSLSVAGIWFAILAGAWSERSRKNLLWVLTAGALSWVFLGAGLILVLPNAAIPMATLIGILVYLFSYKFIELEQNSFIPIPKLSSEEKIPEYQQQYPYTVEPRDSRTYIDPDSSKRYSYTIQTKELYEHEPEEPQESASRTYIDHNGYQRYSDSQRLVHMHIAEVYVVGRKLEDNEVVHHINGNKLDNRSTNLRVMDMTDHKELHEAQRNHYD